MSSGNNAANASSATDEPMITRRRPMRSANTQESTMNRANTQTETMSIVMYSLVEKPSPPPPCASLFVAHASDHVASV